MDKEFWNERYAQFQSVYGTAPNKFFKEQIQSLEPGNLLLPAEGEGRNAIYAASLGWKVSAYDYSEVAKTKTLETAASLGITTIDYQVMDLAMIDLPTEKYDAVALIYAHLPVKMRESFHQKCVNSLKPGGILIFEVFSKNQLGYRSGGPKVEEFLYSPEDLTADFSEMKIIQCEELVTTLDEGTFHRGPASVVRFIAMK